jgi:hypothetical protein
MSYVPKCHGCGGEATNMAEVPACDSCQELVIAALAALRPSVLQENRLSPTRRGALRRVRELGRWAAQVTARLAREDLADEQLKGLIDRTNAWWAQSHGSKTHRLELRNELIAVLLELGGKIRAGDISDERALELFAGSLLGRWPELEPANAEDARYALRAVASAPRGGQWSACTNLLKGMEIISTRMDEKSVREQFYQWLRKKPVAARELVGVKTRRRS